MCIHVYVYVCMRTLTPSLSTHSISLPPSSSLSPSPIPSPSIHCRFTAIACTQTSLLAVDDRGYLHCWDWACTLPHPPTEVGHAHPRAVKLGLAGEYISLLDASYIRATVMTTSGKVRACVPIALSTRP